MLEPVSPMIPRLCADGYAHDQLFLSDLRAESTKLTLLRDSNTVAVRRAVPGT